MIRTGFGGGDVPTAGKAPAWKPALRRHTEQRVASAGRSDAGHYKETRRGRERARARTRKAEMP